MLRLYTLGELRLDSEDGQPRLRRRKPLILLAFLARRAPRSVARPELVALLWGERPEAAARHSLRQALLELHRILGDHLRISNEAVQLLPGAIVLDAAEFERDVEAGRNREAIERWAADFLAGADDRSELALRTWVESERAGLRRRLTLAFERLIDDAERRGVDREATAIGRRWSELAPFDESASRRLILALRRQGHAVEALAIHSSFVASLAEHLDQVPSRSFMRMSGSLAAAEQHDRSSDHSVAPRRVLPLVGRESVFAALTAAWDAPGGEHAGVIVIDSPRGTGATRLAQDFAAWVADQPDEAMVLRAARIDEHAPYRSVSLMLERLAASPAMGGLSPDRLRQLAFLLPRLRERFSTLPAPGERPSAEELTGAVRDAMEAAADDGRVLLAVGRLADLDAESRAMIVDVASVARGTLTVLIVVQDQRERISLRRALGREPTLVIPALEPLSVSDIRGALDACARLAREDRDALATLLHQDTGGVPLYLAAAIDDLSDEGILQTSTSTASTATRFSSLPLPVSQRTLALVRHRLRTLSAHDLRILESCGVLGVPAPPALVSQVAEMSSTECGAVIADLEQRRWLARDDRGAVSVAPPIVARAITSIIPTLRREAMHSHVARLLQSKRRWGRTRSDRDRIGYHRQQSAASSSSRSRSIPGWTAAVAVVLFTAGGLLWWRRTPAPPPGQQNVAIFPFAVSGGSRFGFLKAGMVDLLSTSLDGAVGLHTVDPRVVLAATTSAGTDRPLTPDQARRIARRLGVAHFVLGTVVAVGTRLQASAILYDVTGAVAPIARASAEGSEGSLFDIVDRLTAQLAVTQGSASAERLTQLAAVTTTSLDALKAYLIGRSAYRANDLFLALASYQRAVAADSTFALAWYGLASTASWMMRPDIEQRAAAEAVRQDGRLSARDRALVVAFAAYSRGAADTAERLATSITGTYDDVEGWVLLGEVLYHHNWKRGRSLVESRRAWQRVLALDPTFWPALQHLAEVAAVEGRAAEADSLLKRYEHSVGTTHMMIASRAMRAYAYSDSGSRLAVAPLLANDRGFWLALSVWYVSVMGRDVPDGRALAKLLIAPSRSPEQQGFGRILLAHLALAQGRWHEARAELVRAREQTPVDALEYEALLQLAPFVSTPDSEVRLVRVKLSAQPTSTVDNTLAMSWPHTMGAMRPIARAYLLGMTGARRRADVDRARGLATLATFPEPPGAGSMREGFTASIRAEHALGQRRPAAALSYLEHGARETPFVAAWTSGFVSQAYERYQRAELLHELHRDDEALRWYGTFGENSPYDLVYLAPATYRQAQIYDARGERAMARARYGRFVELWKDCDPELAPMVADARTRLVALR